MTSEMTKETIDQIESVFQRINREIWIVTAADAERRGGLVATWVSQAAIDCEKPVALVTIATNHFTRELIDASGAFALHLISARQIHLAWNFALGTGRRRDKLAGLETRQGGTGSPILQECLAWLDCRVFSRLATGDRVYYWADVLAGQMCGTDPPLTEHDLLAAATPEQLERLAKNRDADVQLQRPLQAQWREAMPEYLRPRG